MTLNQLIDRCNEVVKKNPELGDKFLALNGECLEIAEFIEDEEANEDNNWAPEGHWKHGEFIGYIESER